VSVAAITWRLLSHCLQTGVFESRSLATTVSAVFRILAFRRHATIRRAIRSSIVLH
jgi:hypothetical protein